MDLYWCWMCYALLLQCVQDSARKFHLLESLDGRWYIFTFHQNMPFLPYLIKFLWRIWVKVTRWTPSSLDGISVHDSFRNFPNSHQDFLLSNAVQNLLFFFQLFFVVCFFFGFRYLLKLAVLIQQAHVGLQANGRFFLFFFFLQRRKRNVLCSLRCCIWLCLFLQEFLSLFKLKPSPLL